MCILCEFFFSSRRRHTRLVSDWSSDVCSSDLDILEPEEKEEEVSKPESEIDSLLSDVAQDSLDLTAEVNPLLSKLIPANPGSHAIARVLVSDTAEIGGYLRMPQIRRLLGNDVQFTKFLWERPAKEVEIADRKSTRLNSSH